MHVYADVVLNHRMGGDETEEVEIEEICCDNRNCVQSAPYKIKAWSHYKFPGRGGQVLDRSSGTGSTSTPSAPTPTSPDERGKIYRVVGKTFSGEVCFEYGNFDYLMGADVDMYHPDVRDRAVQLGRVVRRRRPASTASASTRSSTSRPASTRTGSTTSAPSSPSRELFGVGEYWSGDVDELQAYLGRDRRRDAAVRRAAALQAASRRRQKGRDFDLPKIFDGTLVAATTR